MQERRHTRRMRQIRRRIRKRVLFAFAFLGFSVILYESAQTFQQDQIASNAAVTDAVADMSAPAAGTAVQPQPGAALQGPAAVGLAFRINGDPGLLDRYARIRDRGTGEPVKLPELVTRR